ncbi:MAG: DUF4115 domain-containing protein, partial [Candidatus Omnitrophica bacterium]|nr:DUF4115 domain-containing protein [Candidatus Omnitrophota bacterium]
VAESVETVKTEQLHGLSPVRIWIASIVFLCFLISLMLLNRNARPKENAVSADVGYSLSASVEKIHTVRIKAIDDTWIRVITDGKKTVERILKAGESISVSGNEILIRTGNAGGLLIEKDGKTSGPFGKSGQVKEFRISSAEKIP